MDINVGKRDVEMYLYVAQKLYKWLVVFLEDEKDFDAVQRNPLCSVDKKRESEMYQQWKYMTEQRLQINFESRIQEISHQTQGENIKFDTVIRKKKKGQNIQIYF